MGRGRRPRATHGGAEIDRIEHSNVYRMPWLSGQRCILPVSGFYVWQLTRAKYRQPTSFVCQSDGFFRLAAVWDRSVAEDDDVIESCSVIRCLRTIFLLTCQFGFPHARDPPAQRLRHLTAGNACPSESRAPALQSSMDASLCGQSAGQLHRADDAGLIRPVFH